MDNLAAQRAVASLALSTHASGRAPCPLCMLQVISRDGRGSVLGSDERVNLRMPDSVATRRHLFLLSFLAPFPLPERARMSGRHRRYLLVPDRQDMPSRIASIASTPVQWRSLAFQARVDFG